MVRRNDPYSYYSESVAGFCATMNEGYTKYHSMVSFQKSGQELIDGLKLCMTESLRQYFKQNNSLPACIIVYRDGVGDGMLQAVVDHEISQIQATFSEFGGYKPKLTVIIVKKRINTRLFDRCKDFTISIVFLLLQQTILFKILHRVLLLTLIV